MTYRTDPFIPQQNEPDGVLRARPIFDKDDQVEDASGTWHVFTRDIRSYSKPLARCGAVIDYVNARTRQGGEPTCPNRKCARAR